MSQLQGSEKAQPDTGALNVGEFAGQASQKVQLDIDDAPFLMAFEDSALPVPAAVALEPEPADTKPRRFWEKRPFQISAGGLLVLLLAAAAYFWFFMGPAKTIPANIEPTVIVVPSEKTLESSKDFAYAFDPFMVEQRASGIVRFLQARFTVVSTSADAITEAKGKLLVLRDAIFYYLRNKTHEYLVDPDNAQTIKQDLLDIINGYLVKGKLDDILFENYIMT